MKLWHITIWYDLQDSQFSIRKLRHDAHMGQQNVAVGCYMRLLMEFRSNKGILISPTEGDHRSSWNSIVGATDPFYPRWDFWIGEMDICEFIRKKGLDISTYPLAPNFPGTPSRNPTGFRRDIPNSATPTNSTTNTERWGGHCIYLLTRPKSPSRQVYSVPWIIALLWLITSSNLSYGTWWLICYSFLDDLPIQHGGVPYPC